MWRTPTKKPTPSGYAVIIVFSALAFIVPGIIAIAVAFRAPAEKQEMAATLVRGGLVSVGIGMVILLLFRLFRRFTG